MQDNIPKPILKPKAIISSANVSEPPPRKLLDRVRDAIRVKHYSYKIGFVLKMGNTSLKSRRVSSKVGSFLVSG